MSIKKDTDGETPTTAPAAALAPVTDVVIAHLTGLGIDEALAARLKDHLGLEQVDDVGMIQEDWLTALELKPIQLAKLKEKLGLDKPVAPAATSTVDPASSSLAYDALLPEVPSDDAWLTALKTGGVLKVDQATVISAIRAALAKRFGLFDVPERILKAMEKFADSSDEPVGEEFFSLSQLLTQRNYGDIFAAIPGLTGRFVTEARKRELFARIDRHLWPAIVGFNEQLRGYMDTWQQGTANPAMMMNAMMAMAGGGRTMLPPGMLEPPDTGFLRDAADAVNDHINRVFSGMGVPIANALAYEAGQIRKTLLNGRLPSLIGVANRDQMLKTLDIAISATDARTEQNLARYVQAVMKMSGIGGGQEEQSYISALFILGGQIPWTSLGLGNASLTGPRDDVPPPGGRRRVTGIGPERL